MATDLELRPIAIRVAGNDIRRLHASHYSPYQFAQYLLEHFKRAGVPVYGVLELKLAHGKICKVKDKMPDFFNGAAPRATDYFEYVWLPESTWNDIQAAGGLS